MPMILGGSGTINTSSSLAVAVAGVEDIRVDSAGNVGINTNSPSGKLAIRTPGADGLVMEKDPSSTGNSSRIFFLADGTNFAMCATANTLSMFSGSIAQNSTGTQRVSMDSAGRVTKTNQPSFFVWSNFSFGGGPGPSVVYVFANVDHNIGNGYSTSTGRFTAPIAGRYLLMAGVLSRGSAGMNLIMRKNGASLAFAEDSRTGGFGEANITVVANLAAGDFIEIYLSNASYGGLYDWFSGHLLG